MAKKAKVRLDENGMGQFLAGAEVRRMVRSSGDRIAAAAGQGIEADTWISPTRGTSKRGYSSPPRVVSGVKASTWRGHHRQARDNVILRARDAGRV